MKDESEDIADDEWLLRRVRIERFRLDNVPIISPNAFEPRVKGKDPDTEGISFYRAACLADPIHILATVAAERQGEYGIVRLQVSSLKSLGLTVKRDPADGIKGHVVIPELNAVDYASNKARFTPIKLQLAEEASKDENIIKRPGEPFGE